MAIFSNSIIPAAAAAAAGDVVTKSLRFNDADNAYLSRTPSAGNRTTWTFSTWVKRAELGTRQIIFACRYVGNRFYLEFSSGNTIQLSEYGPYTLQLITNAVYRDVGSWYHIVFKYDSTPSTPDSTSVSLYVNGEQVTSFSTATYPSQNVTTSINAAALHTIGERADLGGSNYDGYLADVNFIDGTALTPTSFAEEDATTGQWKPKDTSGLTFGSAGFRLDFEDDTAIGNDVSGNNNDFTATNLAASDVGNSTPTDTLATLNPLVTTHSGAGDDTFSEGNTKVVTETAGRPTIPSTIFMPPSSGTYYAEFTLSASAAMYGIVRDDAPNNADAYYSSKTWGYYAHNKVNNGSGTALSGTGPSYPAKLGASYNTSTGEMKFYVAGVDVGGFTSLSTAYSYAFFVGDGSGGASRTIDIHFDSDDWDNTPSGVIQLSTANLPTPTIAKPSAHFSATTYTGNSTTNAITTGLEPDLLWIKNRANTGDMYHELYDDVRGLLEGALNSNTSGTGDGVARIASLDSTGFTTASTSYAFTNATGNTYVAWNWKKSATAGFNIVTWTGNDDGMGASPVPQAITHGLNPLTPEMIIAKNRVANSTTTGDWAVWHKDLTSGNYLTLNGTGGQASWGDALFSSIGATTASVSNDTITSSIYLNYADNTGGYGDDDTYVGYFIASVEGYSKVGSISGSSTAFIYTGFRPSFILAKRYDATGGNWMIFDDKREGYNVDNDDLMANSSAIEATTNHIDILSNGFKIRTSDADLNAGTVIYYAVGQSLKYASAR